MARLLRYDGSRERDPAVSAWLTAQSGELGSLARQWFTSMRECGADLRELVHACNATVCVHDVLFADVGNFKAHVNVGFFRGDSLPDPARLRVGTGTHMRHVKLVPGTIMVLASLQELVRAAYCVILARLTDDSVESGVR